ncbi:hypothetical protein AYL99_10608 [Fonsecaea erecta]|uniref:Glycosyl transferase family 25 domain-containing protein n=1 Tax=Fonsecaea erecta TaxID=1367422 RepID=A0A178Z560_9EURO|nr:hypothetical protein AYL99_10608 [Fonsecaea erecta]OAP54908.1 hypothetical protein AYL99_10608 [Fonsecaea erecta]
MFPRFKIAGFAITLTVVFLIGARFKPSFPDFDSSVTVLGFGSDVDDGRGRTAAALALGRFRGRGGASSSSSSQFDDDDDVQDPNPFENVRVGDVFFDDDGLPEGGGLPGFNINDARNSTLGFAKVFVISMPERSDKRDAFSLQARLSNITFEVRDGVAGADVSAKALPHSFAQDAGATGCWRAHLNVMQEMVRDNIQSAMVFEDDADWDLAIKYQMMQAAKATRFLTAQPDDEKPLSPYGNYWDIIWFGHCAAQTDPANDRRFVVTDDPTVLPPWSRSEFVHPDMSIWEEDSDDYLNFQTRIYFRSSWNSCTAAYAISLRGAEKVVFTESMVPFNDPVDNGMGAMCNQHALDFTCIAPFPTVVGVSKPAGASNRGSDIRGLDNEDVVEEGRSEKIMYSTRQNIPRILTGEDEFLSVFPSDQVPPLPIKEIGRGLGHPEWVWKGTRFFDEDEYMQARTNEPQEPEGGNGEDDHESQGEEWTSPMEEEPEHDSEQEEEEERQKKEQEEQEEKEREREKEKEKEAAVSRDKQHKEKESQQHRGESHRYRKGGKKKDQDQDQDKDEERDHDHASEEKEEDKSDTNEAPLEPPAPRPHRYRGSKHS